MSTSLVALATDDDLLVSVPVTDLRALLEVALVQMDETDPDVADAYGLEEGDPERLATAARVMLDALPIAPPKPGDVVLRGGAYYTVRDVQRTAEGGHRVVADDGSQWLW